MLIHLVCFKYRTDASDASRAEHRQQLAALSDLPGIVEFKVGADIVRNARSYDTGLLVRFVDRAALDAYQVDPRHVPVATSGVSLSEHIVAVDFEE